MTNNEKKNSRGYNVGESNYSMHNIQPWDIWIEYDLNGFEADVVKRILREKGTTRDEVLKNRLKDWEKIRHIAEEVIEHFADIYGRD